MSNDDPRKTTLGWANVPHAHHPQPEPEPWQGPPMYGHQEHPQLPPQQGYPYPPPQPQYIPNHTPEAQPQYTPQYHYHQSHQQQGYQLPHQGYQLPDYLQTPPGYPAVNTAGYHAPQYTQEAYAPTAAQYVTPQHQHQHQPLLQPQPAKPSKQAKPAKQRMARGSERPIPNADATTAGSQRVRFIRLTYLHLLFALVAFGALLYLLNTNPFLVERVSYPLVKFALGGRWNWGVVLGVFMVVSWIADYWARHAGSRGVQYAGLAFYIVAEALIFVPLLAIVEWKTQAILARGGGDPHIIRDSAYITLGIFTALTLSVYMMRKDFSFLRSGLMMATGAAATMIILSLTFGFNLGLAFSVGMVLLAAGYILYQTSEVLAHYDPRQHVAASLALFSSVALMFWYVIRIVMRSRQ